MDFIGKNKERFEVVNVTHEQGNYLKNVRDETLSLLWFESDNNEIEIDSIPYVFNKDTLVCLTEFHQVETKSSFQLKLLRFNRPFYCILDHDSEVGCKGILYYGSNQTPVLSPKDDELETLQAVWKMLELEMRSRDNLQQEMLQMMLKRLLILCTRIYKTQNNYSQIVKPQLELVREFNYLVETNFRNLHNVADYAELLYKSPKTLANVFKKIGKLSPLQFIQARIIIEARKLLMYSDKSISEIAFELGYKDVQTFSRFFKKHENRSPLDFRNIK